MANAAELEKQENKVEKLRKTLRNTKEELSEKAKGIKKKWAAYNASQPTIEVLSMTAAATLETGIAVGIDKICTKINPKWAPLFDGLVLIMGGVGYGVASSGTELQPSGVQRFGAAFGRDLATLSLYRIEYGLLKMALNARAQNALMAQQFAALQAAQQQPQGGSGQQPSQ